MERNEAIQFTQKFIDSLTVESAQKIFFEDCEKDLAKIMEFAWNTGVGGWYFDSECTQFCSDVIIRSIVNKSLRNNQNHI